jgi:hypothetical protein
MEPRRQAGLFVLITDWQAMHLAPLRSGDSAPHGIEKDAATVAAESEARYPHHAKKREPVQGTLNNTSC